MITIRKSAERGRSHHGWARSAHSFSFGSYFDISHQGYGSLYVLNEDAIAPGRGFPEHGHRDVEIVSYVLSGELAHRDNLAPAGPDAAPLVLRAGDVQRMTAGTGVLHSEYNNLQDAPAHFLQMWFEPLQRGAPPGHAQKHFAPDRKQGRLIPVISPSGTNGSLSINADVTIEAALLDAGDSVQKRLPAARLAYAHVARGTLRLNGMELSGGDGALLDSETDMTLSAAERAEVLVFDLAR